ncbi:hypothetical protein G5I_13959 [Acromyrmex echinatior]|uniref:Uncharacterized protein n=1 Tax=Acromyrmex echinatior TaxID=103372 RepID=F4X6E1_ACREC|nr:hypothetical protein G5I_13959 [Acromyrmex echinatior]
MTSGLCAVCSHRRVAPAGGPLEHRAGCSRAALRNVPCHPSHLTSLSSHLHPEEVFSVGAELHRPLCILHPEHILQDERGCGFEEAKRFARDKRICFTAMRRRIEETNNNFLSSLPMIYLILLLIFEFRAMLQGHCAMLQSLLLLLRSSIISIYRNPDETLALSTATARLESDRQRSEQQKTHVLDIQVFKFYKLYNNEKAQVAYLIFVLFFAGAQEKLHRIPYESLFYLAGHSDIPVLNLVAQTHFGAFFASLSFFFIYLIQNPMAYWFSGFSNHTYKSHENKDIVETKTERYEAAYGKSTAANSFPWVRPIPDIYRIPERPCFATSKCSLSLRTNKHFSNLDLERQDSDSRQKQEIYGLFQHRNIPLGKPDILYQVQHTLADVTVVDIFSTAEYDSVYSESAVGNDALPVLSTCTCLTRPGVRPIVICGSNHPLLSCDGPEEKNASGGSHEKVAKYSRRHFLDDPSHEREHIVTQGGLRRDEKENESGTLSLPITPSERERSLLPRNWIKRNGDERLTLNSLNASRTNVETCISAQSAPNLHVPLRKKIKADANSMTLIFDIATLGKHAARQSPISIIAKSRRFYKDVFHDSLGILFAWKISSDTYSLKLKNITRHNLLPTTCQSIEYVARDVSPGMSCGR